MLRLRRWWMSLVTLWCLGAVIDLVQAADTKQPQQPRSPGPEPWNLPPWTFLLVSLLSPIAIAALVFVVDSLARGNRHRRQRLMNVANDSRALVSRSVPVRPL